jgi:hypothetical protein
VPDYYPYKTVEFVDGAAGNEGGISFLRMGKGADLTTLTFKYASHGLSHGHYDQLGISLFDKGEEILQDYGSVRFVGVEQKWGGRYLPENKSYAAQTVAHSTIVSDEKSHYDSKEAVAEKHHGRKLFSSVTNPKIQVVSAREKDAYPDIDLHRTLYLMQLPAGKRIVVDLFHAVSTAQHQYDLPFQYKGQLINTSFKYTGFTTTQKPLGTKNGYQFLWKEAEAAVRDTIAQFTFLNGRTYYTISSLVQDSAQLFFTRTGAADPDFNLRREPSYIIRKQGAKQTFANIIEIHGKFDPVAEFSTASYPSVSAIEVKYNDENFTVAEVKLGKDILRIAQCNKDFSTAAKHTVNVEGGSITWTGPFTVLFNNEMMH